MGSVALCSSVSLSSKVLICESALCGSMVSHLTSIYVAVGSILGFAPWVTGSGVAVSCGVGHRHGSDPWLLWL